MEVSASACQVWPCDLQMTEVFERTVSLAPPPFYAVMQRSSWPLLPGTRLLTRHRKPHLHRACSSSSSSSWASTNWAEYAPDCARCKGTHPRKEIAVSIAFLSGSYSYRLMAAPTICDCFSTDKLAFLKNTCALIRGFTCAATALKRLNNMLNLLIPDFLSWLTLEIIDEIVQSFLA